MDDAYRDTVRRFREKSAAGVLHGMRSGHGQLAAMGVIAASGIDYLYLDQQHGLVTPLQTSEITTALKPYGITILVRVPTNDPVSIGIVIDAGVHGVIVPDIATEDDARRLVASTLYPPTGRRSWGSIVFGEPGYGGGDPRTIIPLCLPMIETAAGVTNAEAIASVPGIDALYVGRNDLALDLVIDVREAQTSPVLKAAVQKVRVVCDAHGIPMATTGDPALLRAEGYRMLTIGSDLDMIARGIRTMLAYGGNDG